MKFLFGVLAGVIFLSGCSSSQMKARKEQRDKVSSSAKLYCEFINGEVFPDIDIALNLEMAKRCDSSKPFSITQYKNPSENQGIMYCCSTTGLDPAMPPVSAPAAAPVTGSAPVVVVVPGAAAPAAAPAPEVKAEAAEKKETKKAPKKTDKKSEPTIDDDEVE